MVSQPDEASHTALTIIDVLLNQIEGFQQSKATTAISLPFAAEASWVTGKWATLKKYISMHSGSVYADFNIGIGSALLALFEGRDDQFLETLDALRKSVSKSLSGTNTISLQACHDAMLRLHVLTEVELISGLGPAKDVELPMLMTALSQRLEVLGAFLSDKQYLLGLRRAAMQLSK